MDEMTNRLVQRSLVLCRGRLAKEAGLRLAERLAAPDAPAPAIAIVEVADNNGDAEALHAAIHQISRIAVRDELAERGWRLDRLEEIAVHLVVDLEEAVSATAMLARSREVAEWIRRQLAAEARLLFWLLLPAAPDPSAAATVTALVRGAAASPCDFVLLGLTNDSSLCLDGDAALAEETAALLDLLTTTSMRDGPLWLAEQVGHSSNQVLSLGRASWPWYPEAAITALAAHWVAEAIGCWLAVETKSGQESVRTWLEEQGMVLERLLPELDGHRLTELGPVPLYPQPWKLQVAFRPLLALENQEIPAETVAVVQAARAAEERRWYKALKEMAGHTLDAQPAASLSRLVNRLSVLRREVDLAQDTLAGRHLTQSKRIRALVAAHGRLAATLHNHLTSWPGPGLGSWLRVAASPWRWPRLVWRYWKIQELAQQLHQVDAEWRQWQWQHLLNEQADVLLTTFAGHISRVEQQVDEVVSLLESIRRQLLEEADALPGSCATYVNARYEQLAEAPSVEAAAVARLAGGLSRQLEFPDDAFVGPVREQIGARILAAGLPTAVEALPLIYRHLNVWWQEQVDLAAPLWVPAGAEDEISQLRPDQLTLVTGKDIYSLRDALALPASTAVRWLPSSRATLEVLRLRALPAADVIGKGVKLPYGKEVKDARE